MSKRECGCTTRPRMSLRSSRLPPQASTPNASGLTNPRSPRRLVLLERRSDRLELAHAQLISKIVGTCGCSSRFLRLDKLALWPIRAKSGNECFDVSHELIRPEIDPWPSFP